MKNILRGAVALLLAALLGTVFVACGGGGGGGSNEGGGVEKATITGTVAGTVVVAIDETGTEVDRNTATGSPKRFTLTVPVGGKYRFFLIENENTQNEKAFSLYQGNTNVFSISSKTTIDLGFVDTTSGVAVPSNNPLNVSGVSSGGEDTTIPPSIAIIETYKVLSDGQWSIVSSTGNSSGHVGFGKSSSSVVFDFSHTYTINSPLSSAFLTYVDDKRLAYATPFIKFPVIKGDTWTVEGLSNGYDLTSIYVVNNVELLQSVPAGTFNCVLITERISLPQGYDQNGLTTVEYRRYFAPGVGLVRVTAKRVNGSYIVGELQSYSLSNPDPTDYFPLNLNDSWTFKWTGY